MKQLLVAVLFLAGAPLFAQDAKVVELSGPDAREAKQAYEELQAAQKHWDAIQDRVKRTYKGFDGGVEFSSDFKFIVPKQGGGTVTITPNYWGNPYGCTLTPANGIFSWPSGTTSGSITIQ